MKITVIGIGRLGLTIALCLATHYDVMGIDINENYVKSLNDQTFSSQEPGINKLLQENHQRFHASTFLSDGVDFSDIILIYVDTPSPPPTTQIHETSPSEDVNRSCYDVTNLNKVIKGVFSYCVEKNIKRSVIIGCTVFPGYFSNVLPSIVSNNHLIKFSYNPEFIQQGDIVNGLLHPDIILIGTSDEDEASKIIGIYQKLCSSGPRIHVMSPESAEICKLSLNCFITTKITFANMIGDIADRTPGANTDDILKAIGDDQRVGQKCLKAGYGYGGPCFPRDNRSLGVYSRSVGVDPILSTATDRSNRHHTYLQFQQRLSENLDHYIFRDVAYKSNCPVPIIEESQKLKIAQMLAKEGKRVTIIDQPMIVDLIRQKYGDLFEYL